MELNPNLEDRIIQKCFAIIGWSERRGHAFLKHDDEKFKRASIKIKQSLMDLVAICREGEKC